jgi:hypothetical protein
MRRHARTVYLARRRVQNVLGQLDHSPIDEWPRHLRSAKEILSRIVPEPAATRILKKSVLAAHSCAQRIDRLAASNAEIRTRSAVRDAFSRLANWTKRAPAEVRRQLDIKIAYLMQGQPADSELIEAIFDVTAEVFASHPKGAARKVRRALQIDSAHGKYSPVITPEYSGLTPNARATVEAALAVVARVERDYLTATAVFEALASALGDNTKISSTEISGDIADYVAEVAIVWSSSGLKPGRARDHSDPAYKARFHRFLDLVLTAMTEPWSMRHDGEFELEKTIKKRRDEHAKWGKEHQDISNPALDRRDHEWLVSDDHLKKGLTRAHSKIHP